MYLLLLMLLIPIIIILTKIICNFFKVLRVVINPFYITLLDSRHPLGGEVTTTYCVTSNYWTNHSITNKTHSHLARLYTHTFTKTFHFNRTLRRRLFIILYCFAIPIGYLCIINRYLLIRALIENMNTNHSNFLYLFFDLFLSYTRTIKVFYFLNSII